MQLGIAGSCAGGDLEERVAGEQGIERGECQPVGAHADRAGCQFLVDRSAGMKGAALRDLRGRFDPNRARIAAVHVLERSVQRNVVGNGLIVAAIGQS